MASSSRGIVRQSWGVGLPQFAKTSCGWLPGRRPGSSMSLSVVASSGSFRTPVTSFGVSSPSRKRTSHPSGLRRMENDPLSGPWLSSSPRKSSVPDRVQLLGSQLSGSPPFGGPNPGWFTAWALPSHSSDFTSKELDGTVSNQP